MKTKVASLLVVILLTTTQCMAQKRFTVEAQSNDISYNLDLQAVASIFGESRNLQDFEMRLNDYDSQISNLDLNNDGEVDYLRVIETSDNNVHLVVIQAVLDRDVFQDVASIVVERTRYNKTYVQVIGDPYMYGDNYIIEPVYIHTPYIFSFFWGNSYSRWSSPYYWGYYPQYYRNRHPFEVNVYMSHVNSHINQNHSYYYTERRRSDYGERMRSSIGRNDYGNRYPERTFSKRNENFRNKHEIQVNRNGGERNLQTRPSNNEPGQRNSTTYKNGESRTERYQNGARNANVNERSVNNRTYSPSNTPNRNSETNRRQGVEQNSRPNSNYNSNAGNNVERNNTRVAPTNNGNRQTYQTPSNAVNRTPNNVMPENNSRRNNPSANQSNRETYQNQPSTNATNQSRQMNTARPENNTRTAPIVNQPTRGNESRQVERKAPENNRNNEKKAEKESRSSESNSNRR